MKNVKKEMEMLNEYEFKEYLCAIKKLLTNGKVVLKTTT